MAPRPCPNLSRSASETDEADLFALVEAVTGLPEASRWMAGPGRAYQPVPVVELEPLTKKRCLFGR